MRWAAPLPSASRHLLQCGCTMVLPTQRDGSSSHITSPCSQGSLLLEQLLRSPPARGQHLLSVYRAGSGCAAFPARAPMFTHTGLV